MREFKDSVTGNDKPDADAETTRSFRSATQDTTAPAPPRENETVR